ncbi:hypothetical protein JW707_02230 [Candidatus Woesearchaeota archaeon]|nr:hypothetical protein [Candidatus Woesearchaeota archaeon]
MTKIAEMTVRYIADHPEVKQCLAKDMINYSKLARKIASSIKIKNTDAVIAACRRYALKLRKAKDETGIDILKKSKKTISIENREARLTFTIDEKRLAAVLRDLK